MSLLRAVILQACAPFMFILAVKWIQESNLGDHGTQFCAVITFFFCCILLLCKQTYMVHTTAIIILFSSSVYAHMQNITEKDKLIFYDALEFIDYRAIFKTCMDTTTVAAKLLWWLYRKLDIRPCKIFMRIAWSIFHSITLFWVVDSVSTFTVRITLSIAASNYINDYNVNLTQDYSAGYLQPQRTEFPIVIDHNFQGFEQTRIPFPLQHFLIERYLGEDVKFVCSNENVYSAAKQTMRWLHNKATLQTTTRHKISNLTDSKTADVKYKYQITSVLYIERLEEGDFGDYECVSEQTFEGTPERNIEKIILLVYRLHRLNFKPRIVYISIGSLIASQAAFFYQTNADLTNVSLKYTVNNQLLENVCPGININSCSAAAYFLSFFYNLGLLTNMDWDGDSPFPYLDVKELEETSIKQAVIYFCICGSRLSTYRRKLHLQEE